MAKDARNAVIISISSDIGIAMAQRWLLDGWRVYGTYRTESLAVKDLIKRGAKLVFCDLSDLYSIEQCCLKIKSQCLQWDALIMCSGLQDPVINFIDSNFDEWENSIKVNFSSQMRIVHSLLHTRKLQTKLGPCVLFFAGSGTNSAPVKYSAYVVSKIALIKMCELLDADISDTRFTVVGPGWVKTKIHDSTLKAGLHAGANYQKTKEKLASNELTPMKTVLDCCDWLVNSPREVVSGRNFSVVFDQWGSEELKNKLLEDSQMYKLRRHKNNELMRK